jgi:hypothetical protein
MEEVKYKPYRHFCNLPTANQLKITSLAFFYKKPGRPWSKSFKKKQCSWNTKFRNVC